MSNMNNAQIAAVQQIISDLVAAGYSPSSDFLRVVGSAEAVHVDGDCCLLTAAGRADFYFRAPLSTGPRWGYRHSYRSPRRPSDAARYLRHGRECMREWGWCLDGADV